MKKTGHSSAGSGPLAESPVALRNSRREALGPHGYLHLLHSWKSGLANGASASIQDCKRRCTARSLARSRVSDKLVIALVFFPQKINGFQILKSPSMVIRPEPIAPENGEVEMEVKLELKMEVKMDAPILPSA